MKRLLARVEFSPTCRDASLCSRPFMGCDSTGVGIFGMIGIVNILIMEEARVAKPEIENFN